MKRVSVSATADQGLLADTRRLRFELNDAALSDEALAPLLAQHRGTEIDAATPSTRLKSPDEWGDVASIREPRPRRERGPLEGRVWWCDVPDVSRRPVVVLSRDAAITRLRRTLIASCTTNIRDLPSEVVLEAGVDPVPLRSA